ncbi:MAG: hydrogenase expression/formation protein HypE [Bacteroidales bacterium]|nr:MAG: hydrogenase expression/formation protein HypE [Bacteroidales bacterium]
MRNQLGKTISLGHGSGGKLSHELTGNLFVRYFNNEILAPQTDSAIVKVNRENLAFTTDSFVVDPLFFPGGDIGKLAVCGTVNDLAVSGAIPLFMSASFIIEEGFGMDQLETIVKSMAEESRMAGIKIVAGDTKVVDHGQCDKLFINTTGIGVIDPERIHISTGANIRYGDKIIVNGTVGDHGVAILSARESLSFESKLETDCACLNHLIADVLKKTDKIRFMRDATRGGLATVLCELAADKSFGIELDEVGIPVKEGVKGMCEIFGFDPLYMANEGKAVIVVAVEAAGDVVSLLRKDPIGKNCSVIGEIVEDHPGQVVLKTEIGGKRIVDMLAGEQLPRIC